jgi:4-amino-4-deoxy-L-arabinose transferase-like glycosyltransferase
MSTRAAVLADTGSTTSPDQRRALLAIILGSTLIRLLAAVFVPVLDDEALYWVWARHLMWGYPDHPAMIAGLVALGTRLLGDSAIGIRLFSVMIGTASTLAIYALARRLFSPAAGLRAALLFQVIPALAANGIMAAPDAPLGVFWLLAMLFGWMATTGTGWAWPAAGAAVGLAIQCKLAGGAIALSLVGFILVSPSQRRWLRTPGPYLAVLAGLLVVTPLIIWNVQHDWAMFRRAAVIVPWIRPTNIVGNVAALLGAQFVYYAPLGFPLMVAGLVAAFRMARSDERFRYLAWCAAPTLVVVLVGAIQSLAKPHYTGPALLSGILVASALWMQWRNQRLLRASVISSAAMLLTVLLLAAIPNPVLGFFHSEARAWHKVGVEVERLLPTLGPAGQTFVLAEDYQAGSQLAFAVRDRVHVVVPYRGFALWEPPERWLGRNGLLMEHLGGPRFKRLESAFASLEAPYSIPVRPGYSIRLYPGYKFEGWEDGR